MRSLYDELLPHFSSRMFNVGCDETIDLGQGRSKEAVQERGMGRVYLDFVQKIYADVTARGKTMQFWGDIIIQHPELIPELPKDAIALEWGYEANHPFAEHCPQFAASGLPFYVCPGTASWCSIGGRTDNALGNLLNAAENGLAHGAAGYLITDWGDRGHWQSLPVSYLGFVAGAAYAWALDANRELDVARATSLHAFRDSSGALGRVAYDLGNIYKLMPYLHNSSVLFWILQFPLAELRAPNESLARALVTRMAPGLTPELFAQVSEAINNALAPLSQAQSSRPDADLIRREFASTARLMRHASARGAIVFGAEADTDELAALNQELRDGIAEYRELWLARCRPGGLDDSAGRLEKARADYHPYLKERKQPRHPIVADRRAILAPLERLGVLNALATLCAIAREQQIAEAVGVAAQAGLQVFAQPGAVLLGRGGHLVEVAADIGQPLVDLRLVRVRAGRSSARPHRRSPRRRRA